ncbi:MAG: hypothetical protein KGR26_03170 [Cyanobacteria bacterium REEB65]|nr:hypothetical protein [Cyanobacteria bacterium REEB65]
MKRSLVCAIVAFGVTLAPQAAFAQESSAVVLPTMPLAASASVQAPVAAQSAVATLSAEQRSRLVQHLLDEKPNPGSYAIASALLPGAGEIALGHWQEPALVWGALLLASIGVYALKTHQFGIHPAFLGTTPYVLAFGVNIPNTTPPDNVNDFYNRLLQLGYLGAAAWTGYRSYELALQKRSQIDTVAQPLDP